jgi:hypothetical protein
VTVVINRKVFESLTASQQDALRGVGPAVVSRQLDFLRGLTEEDRGILCQRGLRFVRATDRDLAGLRRAVQPVYDQLGRNPQTRTLLQRIQVMKQTASATAIPDSPGCSPSTSALAAANQQATLLDGVYRTSFTREELAKWEQVNEQNWGELTLTFDHGRFTLRQRNTLANSSNSGTYSIQGDAITFKEPGWTFAFRWSLYRDVLTFKRDPALGGEVPTPYLVKPWRRVR